MNDRLDKVAKWRITFNVHAHGWRDVPVLSAICLIIHSSSLSLPLTMYTCVFSLFNIDRVLSGVGIVMRKMGNSISPTIELVKNGDTYTLNSSSTFKSTSISFKLDEEFQEETADGRKVQTKITMEGNKFTQEQYGDKATTIIREFTADELITTCTIGEIKCVRYYKAI